MPATIDRITITATTIPATHALLPLPPDDFPESVAELDPELAPELDPEVEAEPEDEDEEVAVASFFPVLRAKRAVEL